MSGAKRIETKTIRTIWCMSNAPGACHEKEILVIMHGRRGKNLFRVLILLYGQATTMDKSIFMNIVGCYQNRSRSKVFSGDNVISKVFNKLSQVESLFN